MVKQEPKEKKISITLPVGKLLYDIILQNWGSWRLGWLHRAHWFVDLETATIPGITFFTVRWPIEQIHLEQTLVVRSRIQSMIAFLFYYLWTQQLCLVLSTEATILLRWFQTIPPCTISSNILCKVCQLKTNPKIVVDFSETTVQWFNEGLDQV